MQVIKQKEDPAASQWTKHDREALQNLGDMCPDLSRKQVEQVYLINEKNFDMALESCLSGQVPKEEEIMFTIQ